MTNVTQTQTVVNLVNNQLVDLFTPVLYSIFLEIWKQSVDIYNKTLPKQNRIVNVYEQYVATIPLSKKDIEDKIKLTLVVNAQAVAFMLNQIELLSNKEANSTVSQAAEVSATLTPQDADEKKTVLQEAKTVERHNNILQEEDKDTEDVKSMLQEKTGLIPICDLPSLMSKDVMVDNEKPEPPQRDIERVKRGVSQEERVMVKREESLDEGRDKDESWESYTSNKSHSSQNESRTDSSSSYRNEDNDDDDIKTMPWDKLSILQEDTVRTEKAEPEAEEDNCQWIFVKKQNAR
ncbi:hypothetical protein M427DRAFT_47859 [Gonapodya prolifera JEL478]|uniref:Uncharacterized protein n=1 Tax=Gonapodya prolifera (strain JEL478) TaxID=1344416 RepID=A0A139A283_GONPJ|nr:hypothetical protein M427DRAFT_47859 [Gonapodya prolifera JEL478]|eukprot:KXS10748.1 hypothetical protein M427DRAFT_47859 [Gonapodya prolifera JEL478]